MGILMESEPHIITVRAPDHIEIAFDGISESDWKSLWARSEFPHPLITVDISKRGKVMQIGAVGSMAPKLLEIYADWLRENSLAGLGDRRITGNREILVHRFSEFYHECEPVRDEEE